MAKRSKLPVTGSGLSYGGVDLTPPAAVKAPTFNVKDNQSIANSIGAATDQANQANQVRYGQGLGVLAGGANNAAGYIQQAISNSALNGQSAYRRIDQNLQNAQGNSAQSAISRGLNNTSILDSLQRGNARDAEQAKQDVDEQVSNRLSGLNLQQAQQANQGANSISSFIANRNDVAPDLGMYSGLVQAANASTAGIKRTGTVVNAPDSYTSSFGGGTGIRSAVGGASGGGGSPALYSGGGASGSSQMNSGGGSYFTKGGGGGAIGGNTGGVYSGGGAISSAIGGGDESFSPYMASQGVGKGGIQIGAASGPPAFQPFAGDPNQPTQTTAPGSQAPSAATAKPYAGQVKSWMDISGLGPDFPARFIAGGGKLI